MSNYSIEDISSPGFLAPDDKAVTPSDSILTIKDTLDKEVQQRTKVENAPMLQKSVGFIEAAKNVNFAVEGFRKTDMFVLDHYSKRDPNFYIDDDLAIDWLRDNKLPMEHFGTIKDAKSQTHLDAITQKLKAQTAIDEMVQNTIGPKTQAAAGITGTVVDIDLGAGMVFGSVMKGQSIAKIVAQNGVFEAALALAKSQIRDDYTIADGALDMFTGTALATAGYGAVKYVRGKKVADALKVAEDGADNVADVGADIFKANTEPPPAPPPKTKVSRSKVYKEAENYVQANTTKYTIPTASHGKRRSTDYVITHRTAGHGFHPESGRLVKDGIGAQITITQDGKIHQVNDLDDKMWHAGKYNSRAIGIEVTGKFNKKTQKWEPMTKAQKHSLEMVTRSLQKKYGIKAKDIKAHIDVAAKSAGEGIEPKLLMQKILGENIDATAKRIAKYRNKYRAAKPSGTPENVRTFKETDETLDAAEVALGRKKAKLNEIETVNAKDTIQRPSRTKQHAANRKKLFEIDADNALAASRKRIRELLKKEEIAKAKGKDTKSIAKAVDKEMDRLYDLQVASSTAKLRRTIDEAAGDVEVMKAQLREVYDTDPAAFKEALDNIKAGDPELYASVDAMIAKEMSKEEMETFIKDISKKKKIDPKKVTAAVMLLSGTAAFAGDGEGDTGIGEVMIAAVIGTAVLMGVGPQALKAMRSGSMKKVFRTTARKFDEAYTKAEAKVNTEARTTVFGEMVNEQLSSRITSTVAPFYAAGEKTKALIDKLLYSPQSGTGAEISKQQWVHSTMYRYADLEKRYFNEWKAENGVGWFNSFFDESVSIGNFRKKITDAVEWRVNKPKLYDALPESVKKAAKEYEPLMKETYDRPAEYKAFGFVDEVDPKTGKVKFQGVKHKEGMIARMWKHAKMNDLITRADDPGEAAKQIEDGLAAAFNKTMHDEEAARRVAKGLVNDWATGAHLGSGMAPKRGEELYDSIAHLLQDDVDPEDIGRALSKKGERINRAKERKLHIDPTDLDPIMIRIDGEDVTIDYTVMFERDAKVILDKVSNSNYGTAALAKAGYKSPRALEEAIESATNGVKGGATLRNELDMLQDLIMGIPIPSNSPFLHEVSMILKDLAIITKLPLVVASMPPEFINTITVGPVARGVRSFYRLLTGKYGKDSNMMQAIEMSGLGTSRARLDWSGFRGYGDVHGIDDVTTAGMLREGTMKVRDASLVLNGLATLSDKLQIMGMELNTEKLAKFLKGDYDPTSGISKARAKDFGIDDEFIEMFKDTFELDENGAVKAYDSSKWSMKKRDRFGEILRAMNQQVSPETTIGATPIFAHTTDLGRATTALLTYPMMQFNMYGLNDLRHMDRMTYMHSMGAFMGSYIGILARAELMDREMSEEDLVLYSLLNVPQAGALSVMRGMLDPASFDVARDAYSLMTGTEAR